MRSWRTPFTKNLRGTRTSRQIISRGSSAVVLWRMLQSLWPASPVGSQTAYLAMLMWFSNVGEASSLRHANSLPFPLFLEPAAALLPEKHLFLFFSIFSLIFNVKVWALPVVEVSTSLQDFIVVCPVPVTHSLHASREQRDTTLNTRTAIPKSPTFQQSCLGKLAKQLALSF
jgi:hypothetical protein